MSSSQGQAQVHKVPLTTQAEVNAYLSANTGIGERVTITLAPTEQINLDEWILPHECCDECGEATPVLRLDNKGDPREDCSACGESGMLITTWGLAQTERWKQGRRYDNYGPNGEIEDDGSPVTAIIVIGGKDEFVADLKRQAKLALIYFEVMKRKGAGS